LGPAIESENKKALFEKLNTLKNGDILVLSGSIARGLDNKIYGEIMQGLEGKNIDIIVDTTGKSLLNSLKHRPFLIKPNKDELKQLFECRINTDAETIFYAKYHG
jgi:1-phosphofructokinase